ncbi:MAG: YIP1 family protein [Anaerolineales bacterium]
MSFSLSDLNWDQLVQRLMRIARFDETVWEEIEYDESADMEAAAVVVIAAFLSAVGSAIAARGFIGTFILSLLSGVLISWLLWSAVTMFVGTRLFDAETDFREMARVLGYANAPMALGILNAIPCLGVLIGLIAMVLSLVIGFLATREALDLDTGKTIITIVIGWVIVLVVTMLISVGGFLL